MSGRHDLRWILTTVALGVAVAPAGAAAGTGAASAGSTSPPAPASAPASTQPAGEVLRLTREQAILMALENNKALIVQRYNPDLRREAVELQQAVFDPNLTASFSFDRTRTDDSSTDTISKGADAEVGYSQLFATGLEVDLAAGTDATYQSGPDDFTSRLALTLTQPLLRGFGPAVKLASLRQARVDLAISQYELRGYAETVVSDVEKGYWSYALAQQKTRIVTQSLQIAQDQLTDTQERVTVGKLARAQLAAAEAEVALRKEELINARSTEAKARLTLLRLLSPLGDSPLLRELLVLDEPAADTQELGSVDLHVQTALRQRPDLNQARLQINRGDLEIVKTRNGLLPKMDLFVTLGKTGYADSFGPSWDDLTRGNSYDMQVGVDLEYPPLNRSARATHRRAVLTRDQSTAAVANLVELAETDIRSGYIEILRAREQVSATAATRNYREETLRVETARFQAEKSTSLLVNIAQRDLLSSRVGEVEAVVGYLNALVDLHRLEGSLLERRGIAAPGGAPVRLAQQPLE
ncbi:MAG: TolC family protein [Phycisphaerae bacterium]|nr:TolC family protein [Phycisphaerae bacterium]